MYHNIIFIGGIHGAGKGTVCSRIQKQLGIKHLSASEVLKWTEVSPDTSNKLVKDIPDTQNRLIEGLHNLIVPQNKYILDGHFCLFDESGEVSPVPLETFIKISPILLTVIVSEPKTIANRLQNRDNRNYSLSTINRMQKMELEHAQLVANKLRIDLIITEGNKAELVLKIKSL